MNLKYGHAPYNFINFPEKVKNREEKLPKHNIFYEDLKTGYIEYELKTETPLFIGMGKNAEGEAEGFTINNTKAIPGGTLRGRVRSNAEILSFSFPEFIENRKFSYRDIAGKTILKKKYMEKLLTNKGSNNINSNVKVGMVRRIGNEFFIFPSKQITYMHNNLEMKKEFFVIDEFRLKNGLGQCVKGIEWMYEGIAENVIKIENEISDINNEIKKLYESRKIEGEIRKNIGEKYKKLAENKFNDKREEEEFFTYLRKICDEEIVKKFKNKMLKWKLKEKEWGLFLKNNEKKGGKKNYELKQKVSIVEDNGRILKISKDENLGIEVILYNSNYIRGKRKHYIIPVNYNNDIRNAIKIDDNIVYNYEKEREKNKLGKDFELKNKKIFFYKESEGNIIGIGKTPYLRLSYENSIHEFRTKDDKRLDYIQGLFGFTRIKNNYKGRLSFTNLYPKSNIKMGEKCEVTLLKPQATSFQLYLTQPSIYTDTVKKNDEVKEIPQLKNKKLRGLESLKELMEVKDENDKNKKNYNFYIKNELLTYADNEKTKLRGQKFYWMKPIEKINIVNNKNNKIATKFIPVDKNNIFAGKIYFENLSDEELGLLLLSLKYNDKTYDNIGMGKPYGYGRIKIENIKLMTEDKKKSFSNFFDNQYKDITEEIENLKKKFKNSMNFGEYDQLNLIKDYLKAKTKIIDDQENLKYQDIKEFANRLPLPTIEEFFENQKK